MLIKLYKVFVVGTECSRAYHLACSYVRNLEGVIPLRESNALRQAS